MLRAELYELKDSIRNHEVTLPFTLAPSRSLLNRTEKRGGFRLGESRSHMDRWKRRIEPGEGVTMFRACEDGTQPVLEIQALPGETWQHSMKNLVRKKNFLSKQKAR